jgi:ribosomal protein S18 acetylase RimI-like enzyme
VTLLTYRDDRRAMLLEILDASYERTLDCPGLLGLRRTEDILAGHVSTGRFEPELWTLLLVDRRPAGAILLNPATQGRCVELVYLGLAPFARGRGLGGSLLRHGLLALDGRPERTVTLAVDDKNVPALRLYQAEGFRRVLRRLAYIRPIRD